MKTYHLVESLPLEDRQADNMAGKWDKMGRKKRKTLSGREAGRRKVIRRKTKRKLGTNIKEVR
jgi:hypothetical protein